MKIVHCMNFMTKLEEGRKSVLCAGIGGAAGRSRSMPCENQCIQTEWEQMLLRCESDSGSKPKPNPITDQITEQVTVQQEEPDPPKPWWKKWRKVLILAGIVILAAAIGLGVKFQMKPDALAEGTCGESLTWSLSQEGKLTIAGAGDMEDYHYTSEENEMAPWYAYRDSIREIEIGEEVTGIGAYAFFRVNQVSSLYIPGKVSRLGKRFAAVGISEITVDEKNEHFKDEDGVLYTADQTCIVRYPPAKEGTAYTMPEGVREIGAYAFESSSLEQIDLPDTLEKIGEGGFAFCRSLGSIEIPASVKTIGEWAFYACDVLEKVMYKGERPEVAENAFAECPMLTIEGTCGENLTWSLSKEGKLTIAGAGDMYDYANSGTNRAPWYAYRDSICEIEIGEEVTGIGAYAFWGVYGVSSLYIPEKVSRLGEQFAAMGGLSEIAVDEKNEHFRDEDGILYTADRTCIVKYPAAKERTAYTVPEGVREIGAFAFEACALEQIGLPGTLERIGDDAFFCCRSLGSIEIPAGVKTIGEWAFGYCDVLKTVTYKGEMPEVAENAFGECPLLAAEGTCGENLTWSLQEGKLTIAGAGDMYDYAGDDANRAPWYPYLNSIREIEIGEAVTGIGAFAFFNVNQVSSLYIPEKVSRLGEQFATMMGLSEIAVDEKNEHFKDEDGVLYTADQTCIVRYPAAKEGTAYTVPEGVREIGAYAFDACALEQIDLPDTLERIEDLAFLWCRSLGSIEIPAGVKTIGRWAFGYCDVLETVTYQGERPEVAENAFAECPMLQDF